MSWIVDAKEDVLSLSELVLDSASGQCQVGKATTGVFETEAPFRIAIDLPTLSVQFAKLRARAGR